MRKLPAHPKIQRTYFWVGLGESDRSLNEIEEVAGSSKNTSSATFSGTKGVLSLNWRS